MPSLLISSPANPRYRLARSLLRRKGRQQHAQLLLEGVRLIQDSISAGFPPALFFYTPQAGEQVQMLAQQVRQEGGQTFYLTPELMATLTATVTPQQVVAVAPWPQLELGGQGLHLLIDGMRDPGNLGTLLRSAAAAGVDGVHILPGVTDPWAPKVLRAGMGAHFRVAIRQIPSPATLKDLDPTLKWYRADAHAPLTYTAVDWTEPGVLVVGGEAAGPVLTAQQPDIIAIAIPMANHVESLNAAVAASIILFEAVRQRQLPLS
ncbi:MAG: RNA methyltransferase [Chloroflexi bacterium]|nr:RNA methyltransferase [Chloroflexota bacterium]